VWLNVEKYERALQDFDQAILLKPDYAFPYYFRGLALQDLKRPNEAITAYSKSIELDPNDFDSYERRANINEENSNWRAIYDDGNKMIQLQPNNNLGYEYRGRAFLEVGQFREAIADFTKAISLEANSIYSYRLRGRAFASLNQFDNAMADYQSAFRIDPKDSYTLELYNDLRRKQRSR
jgi:tetratricopeptide (TPR) repeat protein